MLHELPHLVGQVEASVKQRVFGHVLLLSEKHACLREVLDLRCEVFVVSLVRASSLLDST
jgi:hypothetical protein